MNLTIFTPMLMAILGVWIIPNAIRDEKTGRYLGLLNRKVALCAVFLVWVQSIVILEKFDPGLEALLRILFTVSLPFLGALVFVKYTHKMTYGQKIMFTKWW